MIAVSLERGTFKLAELEKVMGKEEESVTVPKFSVGQVVRVRREDSKVNNKGGWKICRPRNGICFVYVRNFFQAFIFPHAIPWFRFHPPLMIFLHFSTYVLTQPTPLNEKKRIKHGVYSEFLNNSVLFRTFFTG